MIRLRRGQRSGGTLPFSSSLSQRDIISNSSSANLLRFSGGRSERSERMSIIFRKALSCSSLKSPKSKKYGLTFNFCAICSIVVRFGFPAPERYFCRAERDISSSSENSVIDFRRSDFTVLRIAAKFLFKSTKVALLYHKVKHL